MQTTYLKADDASALYAALIGAGLGHMSYPQDDPDNVTPEGADDDWRPSGRAEYVGPDSVYLIGAMSRVTGEGEDGTVTVEAINGYHANVYGDLPADALAALDAIRVYPVTPSYGLALPAVSLDQRRAAALRSVVQFCEGLTAPIIGAFPSAETLGWGTKAAAAAAMLSGDATAEQTTLIGVEANVAGDDPAALATVIDAKSRAYQMLIAMLTGTRRKAEQAIATSDEPEATAAAIIAAASAQLAATQEGA